MAALIQDVLHDSLDMRPDTLGPIEQARCIPAHHGLVRRCSVGIQGGLVAKGVAARMAGNPDAP